MNSQVKICIKNPKKKFFSNYRRKWNPEEKCFWKYQKSVRVQYNQLFAWEEQRENVGVQRQPQRRAAAWNLQSRVKQDSNLFLILKTFMFWIFETLDKSDSSGLYCQFFES